MMSSAKQLPLDLGHRAAFGREDFLVSPCNETAVRMLDDYQSWPNRVMVLHGLKGSGKTHLTHVWREMTGAILIAGEDLDEARFEKLIEDGRAIVIDNADDVEEARILFHLYNLCQENSRFLLLTAKRPPARWDITLKDLSSRLKSVPLAELAEPDDELIGAVLMKIFMDRQLNVGPEVLAYVLTRMERSFAAVNLFVDMADELSLAAKKNITIPLAKQVLNKMDLIA